MVYHDISKEKMQGVLDSFPQESRKDGGSLNPSILSGFTPASQRQWAKTDPIPVPA